MDFTIKNGTFTCAMAKIHGVNGHPSHIGNPFDKYEKSSYCIDDHLPYGQFNHVSPLLHTWFNHEML